MPARTALFAVLTLTAFASQAAVTRCDLLASHPDDPDRNAPGLESEQIDLPGAEAACREAVKHDPGSGRAHYHLGRVLYYQGKAAESVPELEAAAAIGYRQATFVLAYLLTDGKVEHDACRALGLWRRSAGLEHPWSGYHLVQKALDGRFADCKDAPTGAELDRWMNLAREGITVAASNGRVEALAARLAEARNSNTQSGK